MFKNVSHEVGGVAIDAQIDPLLEELVLDILFVGGEQIGLPDDGGEAVSLPDKIARFVDALPAGLAEGQGKGA
ncbi:MAG TPA: hypothetical protein QF665_06530, partial [Alphaproteobacteria bacterium]|nr:hypothetical protein [Alphaproteobacteria bacterium]